MLLIRYYFYVCQNKLFSNDKSGFNFKNLSDYTYSPDYSQKKKLKVISEGVCWYLALCCKFEFGED